MHRWSNLPIFIWYIFAQRNWWKLIFWINFIAVGFRVWVVFKILGLKLCWGKTLVMLGWKLMETSDQIFMKVRLWGYVFWISGKKFRACVRIFRADLFCLRRILNCNRSAKILAFCPPLCNFSSFFISDVWMHIKNLNESNLI